MHATREAPTTSVSQKLETQKVKGIKGGRVLRAISPPWVDKKNHINSLEKRPLFEKPNFLGARNKDFKLHDYMMDGAFI